MPHPTPACPPSTSGRCSISLTTRPRARAVSTRAAPDARPPAFIHPPTNQDAPTPAPQLLVMRAPMVLLTDPPPAAPPLVDAPPPGFEPVMSPGIALAAAAAATPPLVFWARIGLNAQRVAREEAARKAVEAEREAARLALLARLSPGKGQQQAEQ